MYDSTQPCVALWWNPLWLLIHFMYHPSRAPDGPCDWCCRLHVGLNHQQVPGFTTFLSIPNLHPRVTNSPKRFSWAHLTEAQVAPVAKSTCQVQEMQETGVGSWVGRSSGGEHVAHSSKCRIPWTESCGLQSMGSQKTEQLKQLSTHSSTKCCVREQR